MKKINHNERNFKHNSFPAQRLTKEKIILKIESD